MSQAGDLVPFGKYRGQPVQVLSSDPEYVEWIQGQGWLRERYPNFHALIINNFQEATETPQHNALQALFLEEQYCLKLLMAHSIIAHKVLKKYLAASYMPEFLERALFVPIAILDVQFEYHAVDVFLNADYQLLDLDSQEARHTRRLPIAVEIKPTIGDDFPAVLRQVKASKVPAMHCVFLETYTGIGATPEQLRKMFLLSDVGLVYRHEVEAAPVVTLAQEVPAHLPLPF